MGELGICSYGAYIPPRRLSRQHVVAAHRWANPALATHAHGERSICNWDEDSITMAVEAARNCLAAGRRSRPAALQLASTSHPFTDRQNATVVASALDLGDDLRTLDLGGSQRAGTSGLIAALGCREELGEILFVAADRRRTKPASSQELLFGDGAAALLLGRDDPIAQLLGWHSRSIDLVDHFRGQSAEVDYSWEERWVRDEGFLKLLPEAIGALLQQTAVSATRIDHFILPCVLPRIGQTVAKRVGIDRAAVCEPLQAVCGETAVAHPLLMLAAVLETAAAGQTILMTGFGQGCDVLLLETTDRLARLTPRRGPAALLADRQPEENYLKFLSFNGHVELDWGMRAEADKKTALTALYRNREMILAFVGGRCTVCKTVQYPHTRVCVNPSCSATDSQESYRLADSVGAVTSFTADWLSYTPAPPLLYGSVGFAEGGKVMLEFTDFDSNELRVGAPVRMVFRVKDFDRGRGFRRYFWKAAPAFPERRSAGPESGNGEE